MTQRKTELPNPFISADTFKPKSRQKITPNKGSNEVYNADGEIHTGVIGFVSPPKPYDSYRFTKVYREGWKIMAELSVPALKVLFYFISVMDYSDTVEFNIHKCIKFTGYKDSATIYRSIKELKEKSILADTNIPKIFFINPLLIYRGDRLKLLNLG